jgi:uncharacterized protein YcbK (DUF882 family)
MMKLKSSEINIKRRLLLQGLAVSVPGFMLLTHSPASLAAISKQRELSFHHLHTNEKLTVRYFANNRFLPDALGTINHFLRDFRTGDKHPIDAKLLDILFWVQKTTGSNGVYEVISGYRSPETNNFLRKNSQGVAKQSLHMQGKAVDIRLTDVDTKLLQQAAIKLKAGGVGYYQSSNFVHLDTGRIRTW